MPVDYNTLLQPIVEGMIKNRQLGDDTLTDVATMDVLRGCASLAYSQICKYCRREFHRLPEKECYLDMFVYGGVDKEIKLRNIPVVAIYRVSIWEQMEEIPLMPGTDYIVHLDSVFGIPDGKVVNIYYNAGHASLSDNEELLSIIVNQALANYHRRDIVGIASISAGGPGGGQSLSTNSDSGGLLKTVQQALESWVYYGDGMLQRMGDIL